MEKIYQQGFQRFESQPVQLGLEKNVSKWRSSRNKSAKAAKSPNGVLQLSRLVEDNFQQDGWSKKHCGWLKHVDDFEEQSEYPWI